jgi:hypothetical protein
MGALVRTGQRASPAAQADGGREHAGGVQQLRAAVSAPRAQLLPVTA